MDRTHRAMLFCLFSLITFPTALGQTGTQIQPLTDFQPPSHQSSRVVVTATASRERVRYAALGEVNYTRLQVFFSSGAPIYDSGLRLGNLIDWQLVDQQGTALEDGTYLFLVTVKDFSNQLTQKYGTAILEQGEVYLEQTTQSELSSSLANTLEANKQGETLSLIDRIGVASVNRTAQTMPTDTPLISRAGTSDTTDSNDKEITGGGENIGGTGTQNQLAKWIDNSGNLGDSIITESGGNIGIGTTSPTQRLHVATGNLQLGSGTNSHSLLLNYTSNGGGGDITSMMNGVEMLSVGFNNTATLGGAAGTASGRLLYFYDRQAAQYRGGFNSVGEWYWGPTISRYGLKVAQPNVGVTGITVEATGNVSFTGLRTEATTGTPNVIGGFNGNIVFGTGATIAGGGNIPWPNRVTDNHGTVGGGEGNRAGNNTGTVADAPYATVAGGRNNTAGDLDATVGGGNFNRANGTGATIGGGNSNIANQTNSTVGGGNSNTANGGGATVGGGGSNIATASWATVPGGLNNAAQGNFSFAAGRGAQALHLGSFVWSDSTTNFTGSNFFTSTNNNQFLIYATGGVGIGTNSPAARLHISGASSTENTPITVLESSGNQIPLAFKIGTTEHARIRSDSGGNLFFTTLNGSAKDIFFRAGDDIGTDMFIQSSTGNVGIGTSTPARKLHISDAMRLQPIASPPAAPANGDLYFDDSQALCIYVDNAWVRLAGTGSCQ